jgi:hypothetical protein
MRNRIIVPLDLTIKVATQLPVCHVLSLPCRGCGSPVEDGNVYCAGCLNQIALQECRKSMHLAELERELAAA